jgi:hypothetical protein
MNIEKYKSKHHYQYKSFKKNNFSEEDIFTWIEFYLKNKEIIDTFKIDFNNLTTMENLIYNANNLMKEFKIKQFTNRNFSNRYRSLLNNESNKLIAEILLLQIDEKTLREQLFSKLKACNTQDLMNIKLNNFIFSIKYFNRDIILKKINENKTQVVYDKNNVLIIHIDNYEKAKIMGNLNWCITTRKEHFINYQNKEIGGHYFFAWDFNKTPLCKDSMIAYNARPAIDRKGKSSIVIATKFNKNNDSIRREIHKKIDSIIINSFVMKIELDKYKSKISKIKNFEFNNKNFNLFYKSRNYDLVDLLDNMNIFYLLQNKYNKIKKLYNFNVILLIDKYLFSKIDKDRHYKI